MAVVVALLVLLPPVREALVRAVRLLAAADVEGLRASVLATGAWAPITLAGLMVLQAVLAPLPASAVTYASGLVLGVWWGTLLSWASALVAAALCFGLSRYLGRPVAERFVSRRAVDWSDAFFRRFGVWAVLLARLLPVVSFDVVSYGAGLTRMSFLAFIAATAVGMIPGTVLYSGLGHLGRGSGRAVVLTMAALTALGLLALVLRKRIAEPFLAGRPGAPDRHSPGASADAADRR